MGQRPFPREASLRFIIQRIGEGATDAEIQEDLLMHGPSGKMSYNEYGVFGRVGIRTLRNIRQVYGVAKELGATQAKEQDLTLEKAKAQHLDQIQALVQKWSNSFDAGHRPVDVYVLPPRYVVEQDELFPYALDHCPSVNDTYQVLQNERKEYQIQTSEPKKSQSGRWKEAFVKIEGELRNALRMSLLNQEYTRHRCDLCPPVSR